MSLEEQIQLRQRPLKLRTKRKQKAKSGSFLPVDVVEKETDSVHLDVIGSDRKEDKEEASEIEEEETSDEEAQHPVVTRRRSSSNPDSISEYFIKKSSKTSPLQTRIKCRTKGERKGKPRLKISNHGKCVSFDTLTDSPRSDTKSKRKSFLKLIGKEKSSEKESNSETDLRRTSAVHSTINNLRISPVVRKGDQTKVLFMSDVLEHFRKQKGARMCKTMSTLHRDMIDAAFSPPEHSLGAPMGLGMMEIPIDRWWNEAHFKGKAYTLGVKFHSQPDTISEHIMALEQTNSCTLRYFWQYASKVFGKINAEQPRRISAFSGCSDITFIASGYSCTVLVSSLGELFLDATQSQYAECLGVSSCPPDWKGFLFLDKILGRRVRSVSCGASHFGVITDTSEVILWGVNTNTTTRTESGQLGNVTELVSTPVMITGLVGLPKEVACGVSHTLILTSESVYTCGSNHLGQLGYKQAGKYPKQVQGIKDRFNVKCAVSSISCGAHHCIISTQDGLVFSWGNNASGQLGIPCVNNESNFISVPTCVTSLSAIAMVSGGDSHSVVLNNKGDVYTFGSNNFGQLGRERCDSSEPWKPEIVHISQYNGCSIVQVAAGPFSTVVLANWGLVYTWGMLQSVDFIKHQYTPRLLTRPFLENKFLVKIAPGISHTAFLQDTTLSKALALLISAYQFQLPAGNRTLVQQIQHIAHPTRTFDLLQERAYAKLSEHEEITRISIPNSFLTFQCSTLRHVYTKMIQIENPTDEKLHIQAIVPLNESKYQLHVNPCEFKILKRASTSITITLVTTSKLEKPLYKLIHFVVLKRKSNLGNDLFASKSSHSQYFVACSLLPNTNHIAQSHIASSEERAHALQLIHSLATYVPRVLVERFAKVPNVPAEPHIENFPASILFLDISGFTSLNERLAQLGSNGAEIVSKHINSYFSQLIEVVSLHGGDVIKFAGDALICMWKSQDDSDTLQELTLRAVFCGIDIQTKLAEYDSQEGFRLTLHIGVGSGDLFSLWVGSVDDSWEYLVSGEPLAQLRTAVDNSKEGEVVVSSGAWTLISEFCSGEPRGNDFLVREILLPIEPRSLAHVKYWPRVDAEPALRSFIPLAVQVNVDSQHLAGWQNELRSVTVLFVKLNTPIADHDKQQFLLTIHSVLGCMQQVIFKHHGMVRQFLADDKGTVLIAAFGVPPFSHTDDPIRGVHAAIEIHHALAQLHMDCSIGITTGRVFCGSVGSRVRQEYAMVGDTVNLSARLMMAAFKQSCKILCDKSTYEAAKRSILFENLPAIQVKGKRDLISIYSPSSEPKENKFVVRCRFVNSQSFASRPGISKQIQKGFKLLQNDKAYYNLRLLIEGEQGVGKTFTINEIISQAIHNNIQVCHAIANGNQSSQYLSAFQTITSDLLGITKVNESFESTQLDCEMVYQSLGSVLDSSWLEMVPLLNDILPLHFEESETTLDIPTSQRIDHLSLLLQHIIQEKSKVTLIVFIMEDIQWLDNYSRTLLHSIACECDNVFVVCTARSNISEDVFGTFSDVPHNHRIKLEPFSPTESVRFVKNMLQVKDIPGPVVKLLDVAQGNPLLLSEISKSLKDSSVIKVKDGRCIVQGDVKQIDFSRVTRILVSTLDRFSSIQQMILKVASVIGYRFTLATLNEVFPTEKGQKKFLKGELDVLVRLQILFATCSVPGSEAYSFTNPSFLEVVHGRLTTDQKLELHLKLAEWYEKVGSLPHLAYHWTEVVEASKDPSEELINRSIRYLKACGDVTSKNNRKDCWMWWRKASLIAELLPDYDKPIKKIGMLGNSVQLCAVNRVEDIEDDSNIDIRRLSGVSGMQPF